MSESPQAPSGAERKATLEDLLAGGRAVSVEAEPVQEESSAMFTLAFHERQLGGVSEQCWSCAAVPFQIPTQKQDRMVLQANIDGVISECRIPSTGRLYVVGAAGTVVHTIDYTVPSVRSTVMDKIAQPAVNPKGPQIGLVRSEALSTDEFPGYEDLPAERWVQLNKSTETYVVQVKLLKVKPADVYRSISRGEYFVYTPTSILLRPPVKATVAKAESPGAVPVPDSTVRAKATFMGAEAGAARYGNADINSVRNL